MFHGAYKAGYQVHVRFKGYAYKSTMHASIQKYSPSQDELVMDAFVKNFHTKNLSVNIKKTKHLNN